MSKQNILDVMEHEARFALAQAAAQGAALRGELGEDEQAIALIAALRALKAANNPAGRAAAQLLKQERWDDAAAVVLYALSHASDVPMVEEKQLQEVAAERARAAQFAGDRSASNAYNNAALYIASGYRPVLVAGDWLVRGGKGDVYRVTGLGCSCAAGFHGRTCKHAAIVEIYSIALERYIKAVGVGVACAA